MRTVRAAAAEMDNPPRSKRSQSRRKPSAGRLDDWGYHVALTDLDAEAAAEVAAELDPEGRTAVGLGLDMRDKDAFVTVRDQLAGRCGAVHVLVNNTGQSKAEELMEISPDSFGQVVSANLNGVFFGCQVFGAGFAERGYGRIVNIASGGASPRYWRTTGSRWRPPAAKHLRNLCPAGPRRRTRPPRPLPVGQGEGGR